MDAYEIIKLISESKKKTPAKAYFKGGINTADKGNLAESYTGADFILVIDEHSKIIEFAEKHKKTLTMTRCEVDRRNSALPMADLTKYNARIEPGAIIRDQVAIGDNCVIMMGAVINIGADIGEATMIDMNVVVGGRVIVGKHCHIGAGSVLAGVIEPPSATPVIIGDNVMMGANAVVLEGVRIGDGAVVAAGSIVISDVEPGMVVAGVPAKVIKKVDDKTRSKTELVDALRKI